MWGCVDGRRREVGKRKKEKLLLEEGDRELSNPCGPASVFAREEMVRCMQTDRHQGQSHQPGGGGGLGL